jgi:sec-independent protein translocase protein TatC
MRLRVRRIAHDEEVSVVDHLDELRQRLLVSLACLGVAFAVAFWRHQDIERIFLDALPPGINHKTLILGVGEQFKIALSVSFWAAVTVALPVLFYQLYAYVVPAFSPEHQRSSWPVLFLVPVLFVCGVVFAYLVVIPAAGSFLLGFDSDLYTVMPQAKEWYSFCTEMMIALGVIFEVPALALLLARAGVISSRLLRRYRRHSLVVNAVIAAALPGVDPVSMLFEMAPLVVLYEFSILLARLVEPREPVPDALGES